MFSSTVQNGQSGIGCTWMLRSVAVPKFSLAFGGDGGQTQQVKNILQATGRSQRYTPSSHENVCTCTSCERVKRSAAELY